ncbi:hypothetical protein [Nocardioides jishulii]|uniref:hypothetical protein n=1 Tax=Nocardioides jishulii TaxID=2575440 RepID=UPI001586D8C8|nr:hypothetical protein [Nocardioides jishulii]
MRETQEQAQVEAQPAPTSDVPTTDWWHRDHPTFTALSGFFTGMLFVTAVPGGFAGLLRLLLSYQSAERWFPLVALTLVVPLGLLLAPRTRRFGTYMVIGMVLTLLVVLGVASLVLWYMVEFDA